jgi:hypothetical protein
MSGTRGASQEGQLHGDIVRMLHEAIRTIRYGTVTLVIQDGKVIQIDRSEKFRLNKLGHIDGSGI